MLHIIVGKLVAIVAGLSMTIAGLAGQVADLEMNSQRFGATIPIVTANFESSLATRITSSATSMTLVDSTDDAGNHLKGYMCFTIDAEYVCGTASSSSVTGMIRGIDTEDGDLEVSSLKKSHRRGASVKVTDYPILGIITRILNGDETLPNIITYSSSNSFSAGTHQLASVKYVDDSAAAGASDASFTGKGIVEMLKRSELAKGLEASSSDTTAFLVAQSQYYASTSQSTTSIPVTDTDGTLDESFIDQTETKEWTGGHSWSATTSVSGTSTLATTTITHIQVNKLVAFGNTVLTTTTLRALTVTATTSLVTTTVTQIRANKATVFGLTGVSTSSLATTTITLLQVNELVALGDTTLTTSTLRALTVTTTTTLATTSVTQIQGTKLVMIGNSTLATTTMTFLTVTATSTLATTTVSQLQANELVVTGETTLATTTATVLNVTATSSLATTTATQIQGTKLVVTGDSTLATTTISTVLTVTATTTLNRDLIVDTSVLYVDTYGNKVGIGTTTPSSLLTIGSSGALQINSLGELTVDATSTLATTTITSLQVSGKSTFQDNINICSCAASPTTLLAITATSTTGSDFLKIATSTQTYFLIDSNGDLTVSYSTSSFATTTATQIQAEELIVTGTVSAVTSTLSVLTVSATTTLATTTATQIQGTKLVMTGNSVLATTTMTDLTATATSTLTTTTFGSIWIAADTIGNKGTDAINIVAAGASEWKTSAGGLTILSDGGFDLYVTSSDDIFLTSSGKVNISAGTTTIEENLLLDLGGSQDYVFTSSSYATDYGLSIQGLTSGLSSMLNIHTHDGDSTDDVALQVWSLGTPGQTANYEFLSFGWYPTNRINYIASGKGGSGEARPILLTTGTINSDFQLYLATTSLNISVGTTSHSNIITVVRNSGTDPIADTWATYASDREAKHDLGEVSTPLLDSFRNLKVYNYKRKARVSEQEAENKLKKENSSKKNFSETEIETERQQMKTEKEVLPKFSTERMGMMIDDANVPSEALTFDKNGNVTGIDLLGYIGYLHAVMKEMAEEIATLKLGP